MKFKLFSEHINNNKKIIYIYFAKGRISRTDWKKYPRNNKVENLFKKLMCPLTNEHCDSLLIHFYNCQVSCLWRDCHACGSKTLITLLITPVFQFPMPGIKCLRHYSINFKVHVNDWLSQNSLISQGESHWRRGRVPLCFHVCVTQTSSEHLRNVFGNLSNVVGDL